MSDKSWTRTWLGLSAVLYLVHLAYLAVYLVDVPFGDEWELFQPRLAHLPFTISWILDFHNEHRMIWTKLIMAGFSGAGWLNFVGMGLFSFLIYGVLLLVLYRLGLKAGLSAKLWAPFFVFFVSAAGWGNFFWPFQSAFHLTFLFFAAALLIFDVDRVWRWIAAIALLACTVFSMSAGVMLALGMSLGVSVLPLMRKRRWGPTLATWAGVVVFLWLWSRGYQRGSDANPYVWPVHWRFWEHFLTTLSSLCGYPKVNDGITAFTTILIGTALYSIVRCWRKPDTQVWTISVWGGSIFLALGIISLGRASFGGGQGKAARYVEIVMLLLPMVVWGFDRLPSARWRKRLLGLLWVLCLIGYSRDFLYGKKYAPLSAERRAGLACVLQTAAADCPTLYPNGPVADRLVRAREMGATFVRKVQP